MRKQKRDPKLVRFFIIVSHRIGKHGNHDRDTRPDSCRQRTVQYAPGKGNDDVRLFFFHKTAQIPDTAQHLADPAAVFVFFRQSDMNSADFLIQCKFVRSVPFCRNDNLIALLCKTVRQITHHALRPALLQAV